MANLFASRMGQTQRSVIREILKLTESPDIISFAGGLPNPNSFPVAEMAEAAQKVLRENGAASMQYSTTEGYRPLREYIANRYNQQRGMAVDPDEIVITNGSQQGLDLIGKVFLNRGDRLIIERPGYLGAIQAFSMYEPEFVPVPLCDDGIETGLFRQALDRQPVKMFYTVPNFHNPSGLTYSAEKRQEVADILAGREVVLVEDDPYRELRFMGQHLPSIKEYGPPNALLLGSFSKIIAPGFRLGWIYASQELLDKVVIAKQGADLHTSYFSQRLIYQFLLDNDLDSHIARIKEMYRQQRNAMVAAIEEYFPEEISYSRPEGGMFVWVTLPEGMSSVELLKEAINLKVAFVPGGACYVDGGGQNTMRLGYATSDETQIREGIKRLAQAIMKQWRR